MTVTNAGRIATTTTTGAESHGIMAQSIGGGGGTGGTGGGIVAEGGTGGVGGAGSVKGDAGDVTVTNAATGVITTAGVRSHGVLAQSIGGGGGTAGISQGLVAIGGQGSAGGLGGDVDVDNAGTIITWGSGSKGVLAQSIGGGGGSAHSSGGLVGIGGDSGAGGDSEPVSVQQQRVDPHGGGVRRRGVRAEHRRWRRRRGRLLGPRRHRRHRRQGR